MRFKEACKMIPAVTVCPLTLATRTEYRGPFWLARSATTHAACIASVTSFGSYLAAGTTTCSLHNYCLASKVNGLVVSLARTRAMRCLAACCRKLWWRSLSHADRR
jgi:hypothetical protein